MSESFPTLMGKPVSYWIELQRRFEEENGVRAGDLLGEIVELRGKLAFCEVRIEEILSRLSK